MSDFTELSVHGGVGDWHFNRFRIAFEPRDRATLFAELRANFPAYINSSFARAEWGSHKYHNLQTIHFHGYAKLFGIDLAQPHTDWVAIIDSNAVSFTVQTLKREFWDNKEDAETGSPFSGFVVGYAATHYNRMHFLAGRRAWRIDKGSVFGLSNDVMVLETAAVERLSAYPFEIADSLIGLEKKVPPIWLAFLNNFVIKLGLKPVGQTLKPRWKIESRAMHIELKFRDQGGLMRDSEFIDASQLYLSLLPNTRGSRHSRRRMHKFSAW